MFFVIFNLFEFAFGFNVGGKMLFGASGALFFSTCDFFTTWSTALGLFKSFWDFLTFSLSGLAAPGSGATVFGLLGLSVRALTLCCRFSDDLGRSGALVSWLAFSFV